jgi:hypothetical protein
MSEFQVILDVVSRGSSLALQLYENAGSSRYICQIAKSIENFCFAVKLLSGFIQDDNDVLDLISCEVRVHQFYLLGIALT